MSEGFCFRQSDFSLCRKLITTFWINYFFFFLCELSGIFKVKLFSDILRRKKRIEDVDLASWSTYKYLAVLSNQNLLLLKVFFQMQPFGVLSAQTVRVRSGELQRNL